MSTWYLVADIGGTNARFSALKPGQLESELQFFHSVDAVSYTHLTLPTIAGV